MSRTRFSTPVTRRHRRLESPPSQRDALQDARHIDEVVEARLDLPRRPVAGADGAWAGACPDAPGAYGRRAHRRQRVYRRILERLFHWPGNPETGETGDASIGPYEASVVASIGDGDDLIVLAQRIASGWRSTLAMHEKSLQDAPAQPTYAVVAR